MKKKVNPEVKANVLSGMSSAAGAAAGVVVGSMVANDANAAEEYVQTEEEEEAVDVVAARVHTTENGEDSVSVEAGSEVPLAVNDEPEEDDDIDVSVISTEPDEEAVVVVDHPAETDVPNVTRFETMTLDNGQQIDVAAIDAGGQMIGIADLDQDGVADIAFSDQDGNGEIEENEVEDISGQGVDMETLHNAVNTDDGLTAQAAETDYVNDANVDMYYA